MATSTESAVKSSKRKPHRSMWRRIWRENGLSITMFSLFFAFWIAQAVVGFHAYNGNREDHHQPSVAFGPYLKTGHFIEATFENWESEFLEMSMFAYMTAILFQKGSAESRDPYEKEETVSVTAKSPWPVRKGGMIRKVYESSLALTFFGLFLVAFVLHLFGSRSRHNEERIQIGQLPLSVWEHVSGSQFWFESFQNWQSEFLAIAMMVVLTIFLRQKGSAQSKPLAMPHNQNE